MTRVESASSINTYLHCPRQYFYSYKLELPRKDSIATITGKAMHTTLERFYNLGTNGIDKENYIEEFQQRLVTLFNEVWAGNIQSLLNLAKNKEDIIKYYSDALGMLNNFASRIIDDLNKKMDDQTSLELAFERIKPETEVFLTSEKYKVRGYLDAIHTDNDEVIILDYKTSKSDIPSAEYIRQLSLYSLLYFENFGKLPNKAALHFLRTGAIRSINVDESTITQARMDCEYIHARTVSNEIKDYPRNLGPWCNGAIKCDFYEVCFGVNKITDFVSKPPETDEENKE